MFSRIRTAPDTVSLLEEALCEYIDRFGLSDKAKLALEHVKPKDGLTANPTVAR